MTHAHNIVADRLKMKNAVDHAASAQRQARPLVVSLARGKRIAELKGTVTGEDEPVRGCFGHAQTIAPATGKDT
jgi:hypothetical protein